MKNLEDVRREIENLRYGYVFSYKDYVTANCCKKDIQKIIGSMVIAGELKVLDGYRYYRPDRTIFGHIKPSFYQLVKDLMIVDGIVVGYLTGHSIYRKLYLTTEESSIIQIGTNHVKPAFERDDYTISFIKQENKITNDNIALLQVLDIIRYITDIPDTTISDSCECLVELLEEINLERKKELISLSMCYPPYSRALLGAILDESLNDGYTDLIMESLSPSECYNIPDAANALKYAKKWNLI
ncbi:MAG: hypothetical protein K9M99_10515 [Candidatus Cloacimonetes bacterium]|nr:hypothetical protein [Candidatus Cloacimonadota bacterium]